jgi:hypothetical protein
MPQKFELLKEPWLVELRIRDPISPIAYLIILDLREVADIARYKPDDAFYSVVAQHMSAYMNEGKMPPEPIAPAILNLADDYMAGRSISIRAGDYISLQNFARRAR